MIQFLFLFRLPYKQLLGGVAAWKTKEFEQVNGWSNLFVNWGGEDDDLSYRFCFISYFCSFFYILQKSFQICYAALLKCRISMQISMDLDIHKMMQLLKENI